jgi:hypothetical protein
MRMRFPLYINRRHRKIQTSAFPNHLYVIPVKPWRRSWRYLQTVLSLATSFARSVTYLLLHRKYTPNGIKKKESIHQTTKTFASFFILLRVGSQFARKEEENATTSFSLVITTAENLGSCHRFNCHFHHHHLS